MNHTLPQLLARNSPRGRSTWLSSKNVPSPLAPSRLKPHVATFHRQETRCASVPRVWSPPSPSPSSRRAAVAPNRPPDHRSQGPQGRADLVGHLGPEERGTGLPGADRQVQPDVPERQDQLPVGAVRRGAEQVQDRGRGEVRRPGHPAGRGGVGARVRLAGLPVRPRRLGPARRRSRLLRHPAVVGQVQRQDVRRPAGDRLARPALQQEDLHRRRHHRARPRPGPR